MIRMPVQMIVNTAAGMLGITLSWHGSGVDEYAVAESCGEHQGLRSGQVIVRVDPRYFRPTEVETLLGDAGKAREKLGWSPRTTFAELVSEMVDADLARVARE